jgi:hypothetical protein
MVKRNKATTPLVLLLLIFTVSGGCTSSDSPRRSLSELRTALLNHDADTALRYIDVDSVVEGVVRDIFLKYESKADNPVAMLGLQAGKEVAHAVMPGLRAIARRQVRAAIMSDDEWGYFKDIRKASVWYLNITVDGDRAIVVPKGKSTISFRMARTDEGYWRIVEIVHKTE